MLNSVKERKRKPFFRRRRKMLDPLREKLEPITLRKCLPSAVTLLALCMGLTAIPFGIHHEWQYAVGSMLIAGILDGLDGPLARFLKCTSDFGAELDSLADFINFGAAPALLCYFFVLHQWGRLGWAICLFFAICCGMRLARFNMQRILGHTRALPSYFSVGIPVTVGSLLAVTPIIYSFIFKQTSVLFQAVVLITTGIFMVSRFPTFVAKGVRITPRYGGFLALFGVALLIFGWVMPWESLLGLSILYVCSLPISWWKASQHLENYSIKEPKKL